MSTQQSKSQRCGIILAGGDGRRLQPYIRRVLGLELPKQYVSFIGPQSLYERTIYRAEQHISSEFLHPCNTGGCLGNRLSVFGMIFKLWVIANPGF
jgi:hypothetical protein